MTVAARQLIVNADDFGRSRSINDGVVRGHEHGIVTSASLMVRWPQALAAAEYARERRGLSVGLHLDLSEWTVVDGEWRASYEVVSDDDPAAVDAELERQLCAFTALIGRTPTHLDSHQHVHREEPVRSAVLAVGERLGVPVRGLTGAARYVGDFYGQDSRGEAHPDGISRERLIGLIRTLQPGTTELGCHPASEPELESSYAGERPMELAVLCDPLVGMALREEQVELVGFPEVPRQTRSELPRPTTSGGVSR
jgi:chitin disaccharide deacetylase